MLQRFGYKRDVLKYTGFARFDGLYNYNVKNQILVMPTWRKYLHEVNKKEKFIMLDLRIIHNIILVLNKLKVLVE